MDSDANALLHGPLFSRRMPLDRGNAASRISAYIYGNVLVLAALVPIVTGPKYVGIAIVLGTALSTFVAHVFAEAVGHTVRQGTPLTRAEKLAELRNSVPILSSAVLPCVILGIGWLGWLEPRTAQLLAEVAVLARIGGDRLRHRSPQGGAAGPDLAGQCRRAHHGGRDRGARQGRPDPLTRRPTDVGVLDGRAAVAPRASQAPVGTGSRISARASGAAARSASADSSSGRLCDSISASTLAR